MPAQPGDTSRAPPSASMPELPPPTSALPIMSLAASFALGGREPLVDVLRALMAQAQIDPEFRGRFWTTFLQRRRDALGVLLDRAAERGELPVSVGSVTDVVFGVIWYRLLTDRPLDDQLADELVTLISGRTTT